VIELLDASRATGRLWPISGESEDLMRISATLEHGTPEQVSACIPVALALDGGTRTDAEVQAALLAHPLLRSHHLCPVHLPNLVRKIVRTCFMPQRPSNRAIDPIGHVLNKAWPMRCSVRNFSDIVSTYILREPTVYYFVCRIMHACMSGIYPTAKVHAELPLRMLLYRHYVSQRVSQQHLAEWVRQDNHSIVFVAIKEYIAFAVSMVPGLAHVLQADYNWAEFVASVTTQADAARAALNCNIATPATMFATAKLSMVTVRCFKCPTPAADQLATCESIATILRAICVPSRNVYMTPLRVSIYNEIREVASAGAPMASVAAAMGVPADITTLLAAVSGPRIGAPAWRDLRNMKPPSDSMALLLHEFVCAWSMCLRIRTYDLPIHVHRDQCSSSSERSTVMYACACCKQVRAFVVDEGLAAGHAWARGHQKVLLDDATGMLYCGKRVEKASSQSRRMQRSPDTGRSYWKAQQSLMCGYCPLLRIEMKGTLLSFYGKLYALCPSCMCVMLLTANRYYAGSMRCVNCRYSNAGADERCFHCCADASGMQKASLLDKEVHVCGACTRWWMDDALLMKKLSEEAAHRAINERWGANRVAVHCECI